MSSQDADRAQSIQIGAVLLFGVLVILLATYQAVVVPDQNRGIEANHADTISQQMQDLRNAIVSVPSTQSSRSVTLTLGASYPSRAVAVNPPDPVGSIRTVESSADRVNLTVGNAVATDAETEDRWNGTNWTFNSGALAYDPGYNEYRDPPSIRYDNSLLSHRFQGENLTRAGQRLVDGRRLSLVAVNGSLDTAASDSVSVDVEAISASSRQISVTNETGENVTVSIASRYDADQWTDELLADREFANQSGYVANVTDDPIPGSDFTRVHVELVRDETYELRMAKVGMGTGTTDEGPAYITAVEGDGSTVQGGATTDLVVEVRDRFNNPVSGVTVEGSVESGSLQPSERATDEAGRASFEYTALSGFTGTDYANFSYEVTPGSDFNGSKPSNATLSVSVASGGGGGGSGAVSTAWQDPETDNPSDGLSDCSAEACTFDVGRHGDAGLTLRASTRPGIQYVDVQFGLDDESVGGLNRTNESTNADGDVTTEFTAASEGTTNAYLVSGVGSDVIELAVENVTGVPLPPTGSFDFDDLSEDGPGNSPDDILFEVDWTATDPDGDLDEVELVLYDSGESEEDSETFDISGGSQSGQSELSDASSGGCGQNYELEMVVTDEEGLTDTETKQPVEATCSSRHGT